MREPAQSLHERWAASWSGTRVVTWGISSPPVCNGLGGVSPTDVGGIVTAATAEVPSSIEGLTPEWLTTALGAAVPNARVLR